ncbi:hypothetical protein EDI_144440 [Entamoeba dispar SAW760]|uniref:Uncharacterized protein n=1 Tax=Entamoeba dispar (strain ATCC PRA-260 / SAW760) TaxID=370354 RepID=B0EM20_ENTDS|nr:uncharacterized protein EDI_144440 [Entamoeba dispar SAW760]EDR24414.1 hypothetical protein EDI_144440 [Entamoeba dispar SAW760]|eukprot:EDR24414.1 hypothetical protein EDI_144440 [Entamoeba dispar SAW760]
MTKLNLYYIIALSIMVILIMAEVITVSVYVPLLTKKQKPIVNKYDTETFIMERGSKISQYHYKGYIYNDLTSIVSLDKYSRRGVILITQPLKNSLSRNCEVDFSSFNKSLDTVEGTGPAVIRMTVDFKGYPNPSLPSCLGKDAIVNKSVNWENVHVQEAVRSVAQTFVDKFDGDPRISFIEVGWFGMNGMWDTNIPTNKTFINEIKQIMISAKKTPVVSIVDCNSFINPLEGALFRTFDENLECFKGIDSPYYGQIKYMYVGIETTSVPQKTPDITQSVYEEMKSKYLTAIQDLRLSYVYTTKQLRTLGDTELEAIKVMGPNIYLATSQHTYDTVTKNLNITVVVGNNGTSSILQNLHFFFGFGKVINTKMIESTSISVIRYNECSECNIKSIKPGETKKWTFVLKEVPQEKYEDEDSFPMVSCFMYLPSSSTDRINKIPHFVNFDNARMNKYGWLLLPSWNSPDAKYL